MSNYNIIEFPQSRVATIDIGAVSRQKHYISIMLECDVTDSREMLKKLKGSGQRLSFNAWLIKVIGNSVKKHGSVGAFLYNKRNTIIFNDVNISIVVEKEIEGKLVPIPLVIEKANEKTVAEITREIKDAKSKSISGNDIVLHKKTSIMESLYYRLPGLFRQAVWKFILSHPKTAYKNMGNVVVTSLGMMGWINGWFIQLSVHPISFGIGSVIKKPVVIKDEIKIREILNMTILIDHDVVDGAPMARFIQDLVKSIENGIELQQA